MEVDWAILITAAIAEICLGVILYHNGNIKVIN